MGESQEIPRRKAKLLIEEFGAEFMMLTWKTSQKCENAREEINVQTIFVDIFANRYCEG